MIKPVRKSVHVPLEPDQAFTLFTDRIADWWPVETHSLSANRLKKTSNGLSIEPRVGGRILEDCADGEIRPWATVTEWEPGNRLTVSWYVGRPESEATVVDIRFESTDGGTQLELTHSGFEALGTDGQSTRDGYDQGWVGVLNKSFAAHCKKLAAETA
ncbi:MAG: SRPBCC domain-containing protein [Boseongicola sp.]